VIFFIGTRFEVFTAVLLRIQTFFWDCLLLNMNTQCSVETLETTHPTTHHTPDDLNPFFIEIFLMSEWSVVCGEFPFWHIHKHCKSIWCDFDRASSL